MEQFGVWSPESGISYQLPTSKRAICKNKGKQMGLRREIEKIWENRGFYFLTIPIPGLLSDKPAIYWPHQGLYSIPDRFQDRKRQGGASG